MNNLGLIRVPLHSCSKVGSAKPRESFAYEPNYAPSRTTHQHCCVRYFLLADSSSLQQASEASFCVRTVVELGEVGCSILE